MKLKKKKEYKIYHWKPSSNDISLVGKTKTFKEAQELVKKQYEGRISDNGSDVVEIVDENSNILERHTVKGK